MKADRASQEGKEILSLQHARVVTCPTTHSNFTTTSDEFVRFDMGNDQRFRNNTDGTARGHKASITS